MNTALRDARKKSGKTQVAVAREAGLCIAQYQNIEREICVPKVTTALRIARSLGATVEALFGEAEKRPAP